jgi:hypothetical protein
LAVTPVLDQVWLAARAWELKPKREKNARRPAKPRMAISRTTREPLGDIIFTGAGSARLVGAWRRLFFADFVLSKMLVARRGETI